MQTEVCGAVTRREHMQAVLDGLPVSRPPVCIRLDLWYTDAVARGLIPASMRAKSCHEIEDALGFCRAARHRAGMRLNFKGHELRVAKEGDHTIETYPFPEKHLVRDIRLPEESRRQGIQGHIVRYPLESKEDYEILLEHLDEAYVECDVEGFRTLDVDTGDAGLPLFIAHSCPAHLVMLRFAGYEEFFYQRVDFPELVEELILGLEELWRRDVWPAVLESGATMVMHGNHFSSQMTAPAVFKQYMLPYFRRFTDLVHEAGMKAVWHADAEMGALLDHVVEAGFDVADCLATEPLVPLSLEDYFDAWQGRIVCWGGLPSTIFLPSFPLEEYRRYVDTVARTVSGRGDFIYGASDNVMPGAEWNRLVYLAEAALGQSKT